MFMEEEYALLILLHKISLGSNRNIYNWKVEIKLLKLIYSWHLGKRIIVSNISSKQRI